MFSGDSLAIPRYFQSLFEDGLNFIHILGTFTHAKAEISKPFMIKSDGPVLTQEFNYIRDNSFFITTTK